MGKGPEAGPYRKSKELDQSVGKEEIDSRNPLEKFLDGHELGSPRFNVVADSVAYINAQIGTSVRPELSAELFAIRETMRVRRTSVDGREYYEEEKRFGKEVFEVYSEKFSGNDENVAMQISMDWSTFKRRNFLEHL